MKIKMNLTEYMDITFTPNSRPSISAMRERCRQGVYENAVKEGRFWYMWVDVGTGDKRADEILAKYGRDTPATTQDKKNKKRKNG